MRDRLNIGDRLRKLLLDNPQGMTVKDLADADGSPQDTIIAALYRNYGFYVGGWEKVNSIHLRAVWMVVRVPDRAPKPTGYDDVTDKEAEMQRKRIEYRRRQAEERERLQAVRAKLKAERDEQRRLDAIARFNAKVERETVRMQERMERERRRAEIKAEKAAKAAKVAEEARAAKQAEMLAKAVEDAKPASCVPHLTRWQPVPPWPKGVRV